MRFQNALDAVSAGGRLRFGIENVYYELNRRLRRGRGPLIGTLIGGGLALGALAVSTPLALLGLPILGLLAFAARPGATLRLDRAAFDALWERWIVVNGRPAGVIVRRLPDDGPFRGGEVEPDLADYSFDRAVVCDRARTVDLLLANNFHFENACAVLSVDGYPQRAFPTVLAMLRRNARLRVAVLHDCTPAGCDLARRLRSDPRWFGDRPEVTIVDAGLRPRHVGRLTGLYLEPGGEPVTGLPAEERRFLSRFHVELAAVRPEATLKASFRAINPPRAATAGDAGGGYVGGGGGGDAWGDDGAGRGATMASASTET